MTSTLEVAACIFLGGGIDGGYLHSVSKLIASRVQITDHNTRVVQWHMIPKLQPTREQDSLLLLNEDRKQRTTEICPLTKESL